MSVTVREISPAGRGGLSVIEVRGSGARAVLTRQLGVSFGDKTDAGATEPRVVVLRAGGELVDEALLWSLGRDHVELGLHGSPAVVRRVLAELGAAAAPVAAPRNVEEMAWELAGRAPTEAGARILLDQARGALRGELERLALCPPREWRSGLATLLSRRSTLRGCVTPLRVVLAGPVNAGKSTLFNALLGRERVVVSDEAGTTRDPITERVVLGPWAVDLVDTAGERGAAAEQEPLVQLERAGRDLGRQRRAGADLVLWLQPADAPSGHADDLPDGALGSGFAGAATARTLISRADLAPAAQGGGTGAPEASPGRSIRALSHPAEARATVTALLAEALGLPATPWRAGRAVAVGDGERWGELETLAATDERFRALTRVLGPRPVPTGC